MTIEIRQLVIRASVKSGPEQAQPPAGASPAPASDAPRGPQELVMSARQRDALVAACVREVLRKLEKARAR